MSQESPGSGATGGTATADVTRRPILETAQQNPDELAAQLVDRLSLWSAAAGGVLPPLVDMVGVGGVQLYMLRRLSDIYGVPFSKNLGKSVLSSVIGALVPENASMAALSIIKGVPIVGHAISGVTMAGVSAGATWVIGNVFIKHFASGGTLLDFNPPDYREFIKVQKEKFAARRSAGAAQAATTSSAADAAPKEPAPSSA
ncbi:MAG TPA: DUF697 domain-containing protein [Xanthobacteraceae bacterium]